MKRRTRGTSSPGSAPRSTNLFGSRLRSTSALRVPPVAGAQKSQLEVRWSWVTPRHVQVISIIGAIALVVGILNVVPRSTITASSNDHTRLARPLTLRNAPAKLQQAVRRQVFGQGLGTSYAPSSTHLLGRTFDLSVGRASISRGATSYVVAETLRQRSTTATYGSGAIQETFRSLSGGVEQSFTIGSRMKGFGSLSVDVPVAGLKASTDGSAIDLRDTKGRVRVTYSGLKVTDASGARLAAHMTTIDGGRTIRIEVDDQSARYPIAVDPTWAQVQEIYASDSCHYCGFGSSVAISGSTAVVGATGGGYPDGYGDGTAYVLTDSGSGWNIVQELDAGSDEQTHAAFGGSVAISGTTIMVGASNYIVGGPFVYNYFGRVYVFNLINGSWQPTQTLIEANNGDEYFGGSIAMSGGMAVIGAPGYGGASGDEGHGAAFVFSQSGTTWTQTGDPLYATGGANYDNFGGSVALYGTTVLVGARAHEVGSNTTQGAAYLFDQTGPTTWTQKAELTSSSDGATDGAAGDQFGTSVALTANSAFIGAPNHTVSGETYAGSVYIFTGIGSSWTLSQELTDPADDSGDAFGYSIAVSGSTAIIGAEDAAGGDGGAYVFGVSGSSWSQSQPILVAGDGAYGAGFGASVAISGTNAFIDAGGGGSDEGGTTYALDSLGVSPQGTPVTGEALAGWTDSVACSCGSSGSGDSGTSKPSSPATYHPESGGKKPYPDAIDPRVGDFYETTTDVSVLGAGVPLDFTRTYDSQVAQAEATPGPLGYGWSDNLGMSVSLSSGTATVTEEKGTQVAFTSSTSAGWCPSGFDFCADAPRIDATLEQNLSSTPARWVFTREAEGTTVFTFNASGTLDSIADAYGNTLTSATESAGTGACPSTANSCEVWTSSASGGQLTEAFDSSGRVTEVTDGETGTDNTATFCYYTQSCASGSSGGAEDLYSATDPGSLTTTYTYDHSNSTSAYQHDMLTLTPPGGTGDVVNTYDSSGRISTQDNLDGDVLQYCYAGDPSTVDGGVTTVYSFSDSSCVYESGGEVWTYTYSSNVLVAETSGVGTTAASTDYYGRDPASLVPYTEVAGDGGSTSQDLDTYDTGGNPISSGDALSSTDALGNTTQYAYTGDNLAWCTVGPAETAAGVTCPGTEPTSPPSADGATIDIYNSADQLTSSTDPLGNTTVYGYTSTGGSEPAGLQYCTIDPAEYYSGLHTCPSYGTTESGVATKTFDSDGDVLTSTTAGGATTTYTYGVAGHQGLVSSETEYPDGGTSTRHGDTTTYTYDTAGQVISETKSSFDNTTMSNGTLSATTLSAYDSDGRLFCQVAPDEVAQGVTCPSSPPSPPTPGDDNYMGATITTYDDLGQVTQTTNPTGGISITVYDAFENAFCTAGPTAVAAYETAHSGATYPYMCPSSPPSSPPTPSSDSYLGATLTTYDSLGRAIQVTSPTGGITLTTYDADGNVDETQVESNNSTDAPTITTTTAYDQDDQPVSTTTASSTTVSYYDPDGNVYCSVSANAYAEGASDYQCPPWDTSWITAPPAPGSLYSTSPTPSQANNVTTNFYDADGNLLQSTNPDVDTSITAYDADGRSYCSATPTNVATYLSAHPTATWPYLCPTTPPSSAPTGTPGYTTTIYDAAGDVVSSTDATGDTTTYTYDASGDKLSSTDPAGNTTHYCYYYENDPGQCASSANPGSWSASSTLDSAESLNAASCPTASFCVVGDQNGKVFTLKSGTWSSATTLDSGVAIRSISCASQSFCAAGDANGNAYIYNGSSWSSASSLDSGHVIKSLSCPANNFCAAGDNNGEVFTYTGSWSSATTLDSGEAINTMSCATAGFCVAGDALGNVYKFTGSGWSAAHSLSTHAIESVSCTSAVFCAAADSNGKAYIYTGTWSGTTIDSGQVIEQVSCSGSSLCAAATANGNVYTYNGSSWSSATTLNSGVVINSVSCGSWSTCEASDASGNAYTFENSSWSEPVGISSASLKVTCATSQSCLGFDASGNAYMFHGNTWDAPIALGTGGHTVNAVSCPTADTCIAVNANGRAYVGNGVTWTGSDIDGTTSLDSISCPTSTFCEIGDASGDILTYANGGSGWAVTNTYTGISGHAITSIACATSSWCWAGNSNGQVYPYTGSWSSSGSTLESADPVTSISCPASSFCEAGNSAGNVYKYTSGGSGWSTTPTLLNSAKSIYVSCTSSSFCAAVASKGKAFTYNGTTWSSATTTGSSGFDAVSCASSSYCVAVDGTGGAFTYTSSAWSNDADIDGGTSLNGVSCAQAWDCVAVDASGYEISDLGSGFGTQLYSTTTPPTPTDPAGIITTSTYSPGGEALVTTKPSGQTMDTYDQMDDLTSVTYDQTATGYSTPANVIYAYGPDGSRASMADGTGSTAYTYDDNGQTTEVAFTAGGGTGLSSSTVQYGYYSTGVLETLTYPSYGSVSDPEATYIYDDQGNMVSMEDWDSKTTTFTYDADQNLLTTSFPTTNSGGSAVDNTYDLADNLTDTTVVDSEIWTTSPYKEDLTALTRNPDSLIATSSAAGASPTTLDYDASDRLQTGLGAEAYTYDSDSRLSTDTPSGGSESEYSYDTGSELCGSETSSSPSCTSPASGTTVYGYDSEGDRCYQATTTSTGSCATPPAGSTLETYGWDQAGDLTCVTVANGSSATCGSPNTSYTSSYVYNGDGLRVADTPAGGSEQQFTWDTTTSVPRILRDGTNEYLYGPNSITPIEQINMSTGAVSYLVSDNQGVRMRLASTGASDGTESYNSYGKTTGSTGSPFGFDGEYTDPTGLLYLVHRYYAPTTGQFMNVDPLIVETGQPYSYAAADPANESDPTGDRGYPWNPCDMGSGNGRSLAFEQSCLSASASQAEQTSQECVSGNNTTCVNFQTQTGSSKSGACQGALFSPAVQFESPLISIPAGPFALTIDSTVTFSGEASPDQISVAPDGSVNVQAGPLSGSLSSEGALDGALTAQIGDSSVSVDSNGITYSDQKTVDLGEDTVSSDFSATIEPLKDVPPDAIQLSREQLGEGSATATVVAGILLRVAGAVGCQVIGGGPVDAASDECTLALAPAP